MTRQLSKITFVNSANILFGEVRLDGNVHFAGTQGVGKSTLLRAILFFYNADKQGLGIRKQGQRSFDDFYLPGNNSYIAYDVTRGDEEPPFAILVFRHNAKAAFRFVDAPFDIDWVRDESGRILTDHLEVRQRIRSRGIEVSELIDTYEEYRDILYGNRNRTKGRATARYYLLQSTNYQNIPRVIQNVFLNERVDSDFIKNTIIRSLNGDEELTINLNQYRVNLQNFANSYHDVSAWTKLDKNGECAAVKRAEELTATLRRIRMAKHELAESCGMLRFAVGNAEYQLPKLQQQIQELREAARQTSLRIAQNQNAYNEARDKLVVAIGSLMKDLAECARLRAEYEAMRIDEMLARAEEKPQIEERKVQLEREREALTRSYQSITAKYEDLLRQAKLGADELILHANAELAEHRREAQERREQAYGENRKESEASEQATDDRMKQIEVRLGEFEKQLHDLALREVAVRHANYFEEDFERLEALSAELLKQQNALTTQRVQLVAKEQSLRSDYAGHVAQVDSNHQIKRLGLEAKLERLQEQIDAESALLDRTQGSLCEWLDANVADWERTLGRVVDEKRVLYRPGLNPTLDADASPDTLFGIRLDLEQIDSEVRTPQAVRESLEALTADKRELAREMEAAGNQALADKEALRKSLNSELKKLTKEIEAVDVELQSIASRQTDLEAKRRDLGLRQQDERDRQLRAIAEERAALSQQKFPLEEAKADLEKARIARRAALKTRLDEALQCIETALKEKERQVGERIANHRAACEAKQSELRALCDKELQAEGADTELLNRVRLAIEEVSRQLAVIERESKTVTKWSLDKERCLDREPQWRESLAQAEQEKARLQADYQQESRRLADEKAEHERSAEKQSEAVRRLESGLREAREFMTSENYPQEHLAAPEQKSDRSCQELVQQIYKLLGRIGRDGSMLQSQVKSFKVLFSEANTFTFKPWTPDSEADYQQFAEGVDEFVRENKIEGYRLTTEKIYIESLRQIHREFGDMKERESEFARVVSEVNADFRNRRFGLVIRSMELRVDLNSSNSIVALMDKVSDFYSECGNDLGEANLFSTGKRDEVNKQGLKYLERFVDLLERNAQMEQLTLSDTFSLRFKIEENNNSTGWIDNIRMVGSDGTDILVKAIINILLINVFKQRLDKRRAGDFSLHCMMDEIGKLADENIKGILHFANERNIYVINSAPKPHCPLSYRYIYQLSKTPDAKTLIQPILKTREASAR